MTIDLLSLTDGKGEHTKAANFLCSKYQNDELAIYNIKDPKITENEISDALNAVGGFPAYICVHFHQTTVYYFSLAIGHGLAMFIMCNYDITRPSLEP
ncbi:hypothetical protein KSP40_PGU002582 [Platanthera guangdongensis]|uniref:Uncharacterized protein n=1 Tax=Platanthera guangdongensis TaxID=2320717 RepID=A0ABR2MKQ7_9ASPA